MNENKGFLTGLGDPASDVAAKVAVAAAGGMLDGMTQSGGDVWGGIVGDRIRLWRIERFCIGLIKTAGKLKDKGIPLEKAKALPYGEMLAIFDGMSTAEEDKLSELWANLLADAMSTRDFTGLSRKSAALILAQISPEVAKVLILLSKEERVLDLHQVSTRLNAKAFWPLSEEEQKFDEDEINTELNELKVELMDQWNKFFKEDGFNAAGLDLIKNELMRLNLIEAMRNLYTFDSKPFQSGYQVNAEGLDAVLSALQDEITKLVDDRTDHGRRPLLQHEGEYRQMNFRLNALGRSFAKAVSLL